MSKVIRYSKEERDFIEKYFSILSFDDLHKKYTKKFGNKRSAKNIDSFGKYIGLKKETVNHFTEEETKWIVDNYWVNEPMEITYQKFCDLFGENHTYIAFIGKVKQLHLRKSGKMTMIQYKWLQTHSEIPNDCYLSECEGEIIAIPKDIYNCLNARGLLGKGEITKTMVEIYITKKEIEKITKTRLFHYVPTPEHIAKMNSVPKTYHRKFEGEKLEELLQMKSKGYSNRQLGLIYGVSHGCIGKTLKRNRK